MFLYDFALFQCLHINEKQVLKKLLVIDKILIFGRLPYLKYTLEIFVSELINN